MRVLHVAQPTTAGVATVVAALVEDQLGSGWDVHVACPADGWLGPRAHDLGATVHRWDARRSPGPTVPLETLSLARVVRSVAPEVVHLHSAKAGLAGRLALRGRLPTLFSPHAWSWEAAGGLTRRGAVAWERLAARWTDTLVCVSEAERDEGRRHGVHAACDVVPNGVDVARLLPADDAERRAVRQRLGLADAPTVVCVGRLCRQKGQDVLLAAWPAVRREVPAAGLVLVGDGEDRASLERSAGPGVRLVGERDDVADWLAAADVVAVPSRWEGMALVVLEALARGRSVVASDVTGVRESLPPEAGAVVPPEDARALAGALASRLADPARAGAEGVAGRAHAEQHHDLRQTTRAVAAITARSARGSSSLPS